MLSIVLTLNRNYKITEYFFLANEKLRGRDRTFEKGNERFRPINSRQRNAASVSIKRTREEKREKNGISCRQSR